MPFRNGKEARGLARARKSPQEGATEAQDVSQGGGWVSPRDQILTGV